jgi:hypothetical protein
VLMGRQPPRREQFACDKRGGVPSARAGQVRAVPAPSAGSCRTRPRRQAAAAASAPGLPLGYP